MSDQATTHEKYYVPEKSSMAVLATIGLITSTFGAATAMNQSTFGDGEASFTTMYVGFPACPVFRCRSFPSRIGLEV